jgi:tetratricopeptide (TPR) repeat protein
MLGGVLLASLHPIQAPAAALVAARPVLQGTTFGLAALLCLWPPRPGVPLTGRRVAAGLVLYALAAGSAFYWVLLPVLYVMARWVDGSDVRLRTEKVLFGLLLGAMGLVLTAMSAAGLLAHMPPALGGVRTIAQAVGDFLIALVTFDTPWPGDVVSSAASKTGLALGTAVIVVGLLAVAKRMVWAIPMRWFALLGGAGMLFMPGVPGSAAAVTPAVAILGALLLSEIPAGKARAIAGIAVSLAAVSGAALSYWQVASWTDPVAYWQQAATRAENPALLKPLARYAAAEAAVQPAGEARAAWLAQAEQAWRGAHTALPEDAEAQAGLGIALAQLGHRDEAIPLLTTALESDPDQPEATQALAMALEHWVTYEDGRFAVKQDGRSDEDLARQRRAVAYFQRAEAMGPLPAEVQLRHGLALALLGNREDGLPRLKQALAEAPSDALTQLVQQMEKGVQETQALDQQVRQAMAKGGSSPETLTKQAEVHLRREEIVAARYLLQTLAKDKKNLTAWVQYGLLAMRTGATEAFVQEFGPVQAGNNAVWLDLAARSGQAGRWDAARQYLEFNAARSTTATPPLLDLAEIALALKQPDRAVGWLQELTQLQPADPNPWLKLADIAIATGQKAQAARCLEEAAQRGASPEAIAARQGESGVPAPEGGRQIERTVIR